MLYDYLIFQNSLILSTIYPTRLILFNEPSCGISFNNKVRDLLRGPHGWLAPSTLILLKRRDKKLNIISLIFMIFLRTEQSAQNCFTAIILIFFSFIHMNNFRENFKNLQLNFTRDCKRELKDQSVQTFSNVY